MQIQSTRIVRVLPAQINGRPAARVEVAPQFRQSAPEPFRAGGFTFAVDNNDPDALEAFAQDMEHVVRRAKSRAQGLRRDQTPAKPPMTVGRQATVIGGGALVGGAVGWGLGVALQEAGKIAKSSGNPYWSAFAVACGVAGAGIVAGGAGGYFHLKRTDDKWSGGLGPRPKGEG